MTGPVLQNGGMPGGEGEFLAIIKKDIEQMEELW